MCYIEKYSDDYSIHLFSKKNSGRKLAEFKGACVNYGAVRGSF